MLVELGRHVVRATDQQFQTWHAAAQVFTKRFSMGNGLWVGFDGARSNKMRARAVLPVAGRPYYRLTPVDMGASRWLTVEGTLDIDSLRTLGQVVPVLNAAALRTVSLFAVLRLNLGGSKFVDTSSTQIELRREPRALSFPVSLDDLPKDALAEAQSAKLIFFLEARDVDIDFYGLEILGVPRVDAALSVAAGLRASALAGASNIVHRVLDASSVTSSGRLDGFREFADGVNLDVDTEDGQRVDFRSKKGALRFDYASARSSRWRTFEFRFTDVETSDSTTALIALEGSASTDASWASIPVLVRRYRAAGWEDSEMVGALDVDTEESRCATIIDLAPVLADDRKRQTFGLVLFVPARCRSLQFSRFEAFVYDRNTDSPGTSSVANTLGTPALRAVIRRASATRKRLKRR